MMVQIVFLPCLVPTSSSQCAGARLWSLRRVSLPLLSLRLGALWVLFFVSVERTFALEFGQLRRWFEELHQTMLTFQMLEELEQHFFRSIAFEECLVATINVRDVIGNKFQEEGSQ